MSTSLDPFSEFWALVLNLVRRISQWPILGPCPHKNNFEILKKKKKKTPNSGKGQEGCARDDRLLSRVFE
jgi:hypothetical protein